MQNPPRFAAKCMECSTKAPKRVPGLSKAPDISVPAEVKQIVPTKLKGCRFAEDFNRRSAAKTRYPDCGIWAGDLLALCSRKPVRSNFYEAILRTDLLTCKHVQQICNAETMGPKHKQIILLSAANATSSNKFHKILPFCNERWIKIRHPCRLSGLDRRHRWRSFIFYTRRRLQRLISLFDCFRPFGDRSRQG